MNPLQVIVPLVATAVIVAHLAVFSAAAMAGGSFPAKLTLERAVPVRGVGLEHLKARDRARHGRMLVGSSSSSTANVSRVVEFPVEGSWNPLTVGLYYTRVTLGNPPKEFYVQIDTGSDILWVTCNPCNGCPTSSGLNITLELFNPDNSSTASQISCSDERCKSAIQSGEAVCSNSSSMCSYSLQYGDGSSTSGYYVSDTLYFNTTTGIEQTANSSATVFFGCSNSVSGDLTKSDRAVDGIFGFGPQDVSVISQLSSLGVTPKVFSHCLKGSDSGGGILVLGEIVEPGISMLSYLQILFVTVATANFLRVHYNLNLESIAVNGQTVPINSSVFTTSSTQGTIVDSGTTLAYLAEEAYDPFVNAIVASLSSSVQSLVTKGNQCFVTSSSVNESFPSVTLNFMGNASMPLKPEDYLLQQGSVDNDIIWCIGWQKNQGQGFTILGDIVLKDKIFVYDLANQQIGWVNYDCSLAVNVTTSVKNTYANRNQMDASGSSPAAFWKRQPADIAVFVVYIFILAILHR
ncbi:aspartic proteinase-like protein 2 [Cocos nucifera]|uniref:Aspartic proteinase-like protein 2 n=1 Tax=Cocos nucifera TaxID=13894 RepID=A0A8K0N3E4_COCNU|nr:aspartic proteinase-like protein 2 [Cocos nucifera]